MILWAKTQNANMLADSSLLSNTEINKDGCRVPTPFLRFQQG